MRVPDQIIRIQPTEHFDVKTEHSIGDVPIDPELMSVMRGYKARAKGNFVIESRNVPRRGVTFENYRAQAVFERLSKWLRTKGISAQKPIRIAKRVWQHGQPQAWFKRRQGLSASR
jgi:hypothetical protein